MIRGAGADHVIARRLLANPDLVSLLDYVPRIRGSSASRSPSPM